MSDGLRAFLSKLRDADMRIGLRGLVDRLVAVEGKVSTLDSTVLKTGSPVDAYDQRIKNVADPQRNTDAVTLGYLRKYVNATILAQNPPATVTTDAGPGPSGGSPPPTGTFTASPSSLSAGGGNVTFNWTTQNATSVDHSVYGSLPLSGSAVLLVTTSTTFTLNLRGPGGISTLSVTVTVASTPPPTPTPTGAFSAVPTTIAPGQTATLSWSSTNATTAAISPGIGNVTPVAGGTISVAPIQTTTYDLTLTGPGGVKVYQVVVTVTSVLPPPSPGTFKAGVLGWGFTNNGARFEWRGMTSFLTLRDMLDPARRYKAYQMLDWMAAAGVTVPRIICSLGGNFWESKGFELYPDRHPDFHTTLADLVVYCNTKGMMPEIVIFGTVNEIWPDTAHPGNYDLNKMKAHVEAVAHTLLPHRGCFVEISNEWNAIGFTAGAHVRGLAEAYLAVDPDRVLACSSATGDDDHYTGFIGPDAQGKPAPGSYLTVHISRQQSPTKAQWVVIHYGNPTIMNGTRPAVSDEPVNAGPAQFGIHEDDPQYWYAFAAMSRIMGFSGTFHYEGGLFDDVPQATTQSCFAWWMAAMGYPSPDNGGQLFAALPSGVAFGPCPWPSSGSNLGLIGRTVAGGSAYAIVFGASPLPATSAGWQPALHDGFTDGTFTPSGALPYGGAFSQIRGYFAVPVGF